MRTVIADNARAVDYVCKALGLNRVQNMTGICLVQGEETLAAVLYQDFNGANIFMHLAAEPGSRWMTRDMLYWCFHYPFEQLHANRVSGWVLSDNLPAVRLNEHLGFVREATLAGAGPQGQDVYVMVLWKKDWRNVQERRHRKPVRPADRSSGDPDG